MNRRSFLKKAAAGTAIMAAAPAIKAVEGTGVVPQEAGKPATNIDEILAIPRTKDSLPGKYPGKVVVAHDENCVVDDIPQEEAAYRMLADSMLELTGVKKLNKAWRQFVGPKDRIGLKVNPIGGKLLTTSHALVKSVIRQLEEAGIPRANITIWDRRWEDLQAVGFTPENYPGIKISATEMMDEKGSFYGPDGKLYGEDRIDRNVKFYAETEMEYDAYTMPYMVNGGKDSFLSKIVTEEVDKIINIPVLKNAGSAVTLCMKNLAFGSITNTARLHQDFWHETCASIPCFPAIRDKVVLNIVDGMIGCFDGGPGANPQFICHYNLLMTGTDPVAVDRIGYDIVVRKRIAEGRQKEESPKGYIFATLAESYGLGVADIDKITRIDI